MSSAGQRLVAGRIPGERIATTEETSDSSSFSTTETEVLSVTAPLVSGRTYRVRSWCNLVSDVSDDEAGSVRIREDSTSGNIMQVTKVIIHSASGIGWHTYLEAEFTADTTGDKTFVTTGEQTAGSGGTWHRQGSNSNKAYMYVDYIRG